MSDAEMMHTLYEFSVWYAADALTSGLLYGAYAMLYFASTGILLSKRNSTKLGAKTFMISITTLMFVLGTIALVLNTCLLQRELESATLPELVTWQTIRKTEVILDIFSAIVRVNPILSDIVCAWRAFVLWNSDRRVLAFLTTMIFATIGTVSYDLYLRQLDQQESDSATTRVPSATQGTLALIFVLPMLSTNVMSTALIAWKAWERRIVVRKYLGVGNATQRVEKALALLIESGAVYSLLLVLYLLMAFNIIPVSDWTTISDISILNASCIYPTLITLLVGLQRSQFDTMPRHTKRLPLSSRKHCLGILIALQEWHCLPNQCSTACAQFLCRKEF
ncbi:hypothetical protein BC834DRAFT_628067 [Gloeopeniophorella convolvens]|nr:hypothetical protein BC834DRAFT_628067 [Gloeopeniophorella convolvens]